MFRPIPDISHLILAYLAIPLLSLAFCKYPFHFPLFRSLLRSSEWYLDSLAESRRSDVVGLEVSDIDDWMDAIRAGQPKSISSSIYFVNYFKWTIVPGQKFLAYPCLAPV